jgi:hypothetical protein
VTFDGSFDSLPAGHRLILRRAEQHVLGQLLLGLGRGIRLGYLEKHSAGRRAPLASARTANFDDRNMNSRRSVPAPVDSRLFRSRIASS